MRRSWMILLVCAWWMVGGTVVPPTTQAAKTPMGVFFIGSSAMVPGSLVAGTTHGLILSENGGLSWRQVRTPRDFRHDGYVALAARPGSPTPRVLMFTRSSIPYGGGGDFFAYVGAVARSGDAGQSWASFAPPVNPGQGGCFPADPIHLVASPKNPQVLFVTAARTCEWWAPIAPQPPAYRSADGGITWSAIYTPTQGIVDHVVPSPIHLNTVYLGSSSTGRWRVTTDSGNTWTELPFLADALDLDSQDAHRMIAASRTGTLAWSADAGATWTDSIDQPCTRRATLYSDPTRGQTAYAICEQTYRTDDGGMHWQELARPGTVNRSFTIDYGADGRLLSTTGATLWESRDHGTTWTLVSTDLDVPFYTYAPVVITADA